MFTFKKSLCTLLVVLSCFSCLAVASAAEKGDACLLSVDGQGTASAMPDKAVISISVTNFAKDAAEAQVVNADTTAAVINALQAQGIAAGDIETKNYGFNPSYDKEEQNTLSGYRVNNSLLVTVKDVSKVGTIIDTALENGANNINYLHFALQRPESIRRAALKNAIHDARLKADIIAEALGVKIVGIKLVTENVGSLYEHDAMPMLASGKANRVTTPVMAGELELSAEVHIDYMIKE